MIDQNKVATMTKIAILENRTGREMIKRISHRKIDYVFTEVFKGFVSGTVCYLLGLLLWFFYEWNSLNDLVAEGDIVQLLIDIGIRYVIFIAIYILICVFVAFRCHSMSMRQRYQYLSYLKTLKNYYAADRKARVSRREKRKNGEIGGRRQEEV